MNTKLSFQKIPYFDEQSALDLLIQKNNGIINKITKSVNNMSAGIEAEGEAKISLLSRIFNFKIAGNGKASASNLVENSIQSTVLNEFLESAQKSNELINKKFMIAPVKVDSLVAIKEEIGFMKIITNPNFVMSSKDAEPLNGLNLAEGDKIFDKASGYYRMIASTEDAEECLLRFNYAGMRNNYRLTDFSSMNLQIIGVKVGQTNNLDTSLAGYVSLANDSDTSYDGNNITNEYLYHQEEKKNYDIIDVILAGVNIETEEKNSSKDY